MNKIKMLYYDSIDVSEGIDVYKTSEPEKCIICHCCYFLDKQFKFQPDVSIDVMSYIMLYYQFPADLVTFTEEILNGKFYFWCSERYCCSKHLWCWILLYY